MPPETQKRPSLAAAPAPSHPLHEPQGVAVPGHGGTATTGVLAPLLPLCKAASPVQPCPPTTTIAVWSHQQEMVWEKVVCVCAGSCASFLPHSGLWAGVSYPSHFPLSSFSSKERGLLLTTQLGCLQPAWHLAPGCISSYHAGNCCAWWRWWLRKEGMRVFQGFC